MKRLWALLILVAAAGGLYFAALAASYVIGYASGPTDPSRNENLQGAIMSLVMAAPFWFAVCAFSYPLRNSISKSSYIALNTPGALLAAGIIISTIAPIISYSLASS